MWSVVGLFVVSGFRFDCCLLCVVCWSWFIACLFVGLVRCSLSVGRSLLFVICLVLFVVCCLLFVVCCSLRVDCCLLFILCLMLFDC